MHEVLADHIDQGWIQLFLLDHLPDETWYAEHLHPGRPGLAAPPVRSLPGERGPALHREPQLEPVRDRHRREPRRLLRGLPRLPASAPGEPDHRDERDLRHQATDRRLLGRTTSTPAIPPTSSGTSTTPARLEAFRRQDIILAIGRDDPAYADNEDLSATLWSKGIGNALRIWDGWAHDWPYWEQMIRRYIGGHD